MTKPTSWTHSFEKSCRAWQTKLGLTDWTLRFKVEKGDGTEYARVDLGLESRQVDVRAFLPDRGEHKASPSRIALHEMLHLLLADLTYSAAARGSDSHADVIREEHRVIERLLNALEGKP